MKPIFKGFTANDASKVAEEVNNFIDRTPGIEILKWNCYVEGHGLYSEHHIILTYVMNGVEN